MLINYNIFENVYKKKHKISRAVSQRHKPHNWFYAPRKITTQKRGLRRNAQLTELK